MARLNRYSLTADSRFTIGHSVTDTAVKVMTLAMAIYEAGSAREEAPIVRQMLGLGVVGSFLTTYAVKETLQDLLSRLQRVPGITDVSLASVAELVEGVLRAVTSAVRPVLFENGGGQLILVGHCPIERRGRAFVLSAKASASGVDLQTRELFTETDIAYFGDKEAVDAATSIRATNPDRSGWKILKEVIENDGVRSVGGPLQCGVLDSIDFRVLGVYDYTVDHNARELYATLYVGPIEYQSNVNRSHSSLFVSHSFLLELKDEIDALEKAGYTRRTEPLK